MCLNKRVISWAIDEREDFKVICILPWEFMLSLDWLIEFCSKIKIKDAQWEGAYQNIIETSALQ